MFGLIFWIIIILCIVRYRRNQAGQNGYGNGTNMGGMPPIDNRPMQNQPSNNGHQQYNNPQQYYNPQPKYYNPQQQTGQKTTDVSEMKSNLSGAKTEASESEAGSTLAYLEEKARQDAREHAREKREETMRLNKNYGGLRSAERHYDGDSIPRGKKGITCAYCGAENLVPTNMREKYSCYFCREAL
ncbi:MAG: hypothetical protein K2N85_05355 [Lachnospiraceae bacterium]|nr:hypothetical protein [Lachnospiraceae bacterium]